MYDPNNQGDFTNPRQGLADYLGYAGQMGPDFRQYMQGLRQQGQHPWMDYFRSQHTQPGLGGLAGMQPQGWAHGPQMGGPLPPTLSGYQNPTAPRPMNPAMPQFQGTQAMPPMQGGGLMDLARKRNPFQPR